MACSPSPAQLDHFVGCWEVVDRLHGRNSLTVVSWPSCGGRASTSSCSQTHSLAALGMVDGSWKSLDKWVGGWLMVSREWLVDVE